MVRLGQSTIRFNGKFKSKIVERKHGESKKQLYFNGSMLHVQIYCQSYNCYTILDYIALIWLENCKSTTQE